MALALAAWEFVGWDWPPLLYGAMLGPAVALLYALVRSRSVRPLLADTGWLCGRSSWLHVSIGLLFALIVAPIKWLPRIWHADSSIFAAFADPFPTLVSLVWAPVIEETLFRGLLYRHLRDHMRWPSAVVLNAAIFAVFHSPASRWPFVFAGGIVYALLREWRRSLLAPIAAHALGNLVGSLLD